MNNREGVVSGELGAESLWDRVSDCERLLVTRRDRDRAESYRGSVASCPSGFAKRQFGGGRSEWHGVEPLGEEAHARVSGFMAKEERGSLSGGRGPRF